MRSDRFHAGTPRGLIRSRRAVLCAIGIAAVAVALRFWRLSWGLSGRPGFLGFPDEALIWGQYVRAFIPFFSRSSFAQITPIYPTLYGYVVGLTAASGHALGLVAAPHRSQWFQVAPEAFLVARGVSAAMGVATVGLVGLMAARMYSRRVGFAAAALMAVVPFEVVYAHVAAPDVLLTTCTALTMLLAYLVAVGSRTWLVAAAGFAAGATSGTKYTGLALIVPVAWAAAENTMRRRSLRHGAILASLALIGFMAGIVLSCPPCVLRPDRVMQAMQNHLAVNTVLYSGLHNNFLTPTLGWYGQPYAYQLVASFPFVLGWPLYALALFGLGAAVSRHDLADRLILATIVPYFLVMAASMVICPRYLLPLLPALVILAARAADIIPGRRLRMAVLGVIWLYSLAFGASQVARFSLDQQREVARWIAETARRPGALGRVRVGVPKLMLDYYRLTGPFAAERLTLVELADGKWFADPPEFFVLPEWYEIAIERDMPDGPAAHDLARLRSGAAGYQRAAGWSSSYLQRNLYTSLDPAFAGDLWQGEIGFTVYRRRDADSP